MGCDVSGAALSAVLEQIVTTFLFFVEGSELFEVGSETQQKGEVLRRCRFIALPWPC
jgi:hypothetical protein